MVLSRTTVAILTASLLSLGLGLLVYQSQAAPVPAGKPEEDKQKIKGTWLVESVERDGQITKPEEADPAKRLKVVITSDRFLYRVGEEYRAADYKLDPLKEPRRIEIIWQDKEKKTVHGIYLLDGESLKICTDQTPGNAPPSQFSTKPDSGLELLILKRLPPSEKPKDAATIAANKRRSQSNLRQIGIALHNYHNDFNKFPPNANKQGWRVRVLPYLEGNDGTTRKMPKAFAPPGKESDDPLLTYYQIFVGPNAVLARTEAASPSLTQITNFAGTSRTILVVEAAEPILWTKADDIPFDEMKPLPKLGGLFDDGFHALFADGKVRFIKRESDPEAIKELINWKSDKAVEITDNGIVRFPKKK